MARFTGLGCMQDTFARATHLAARPSARATIGYLVYNGLGCVRSVGGRYLCSFKQYLNKNGQ